MLGNAAPCGLAAFQLAIELIALEVRQGLHLGGERGLRVGGGRDGFGLGASVHALGLAFDHRDLSQLRIDALRGDIAQPRNGERRFVGDDMHRPLAVDLGDVRFVPGNRGIGALLHRHFVHTLGAVAGRAIEGGLADQATIQSLDPDTFTIVDVVSDLHFLAIPVFQFGVVVLLLVQAHQGATTVRRSCGRNRSRSSSPRTATGCQPAATCCAQDSAGVWWRRLPVSASTILGNALCGV